MFCELDKYKITMNNFTQFKRLSDICVKQHLRAATFAQSDICAKQHLREVTLVQMTFVQSRSSPSLVPPPPHLAFHVGKWLYWQPILTQPNLWAASLLPFHPHLAFHVGKWLYWQPCLT